MAQPKIGSSTLPSPVAPAGTSFSGSTLTAISARSANDIWAVGSFSAAKGTTSNSFTLTMHFNGSARTIVPSPNPAAATPAGVSQALNTWQSGEDPLTAGLTR